MVKMDNKKKNPMFLFLFAFVAIVIVMFVANYRSMLEHELVGPKAGVAQMSTCGEQLVVISRDNETYVWDWDNLSKRAKIGTIKAQKMAPMSSDRLLWIPSAEGNVLVISNLKGDKELRRLSLGAIERCKWLKVSPNAEYAVAALEIDDGPDKRVQLAVIDPDSASISRIVTKTFSKDEYKLYDVGISNDGSLVVAVGGKNAGRIFVGDTKDGQMLWERTVSSSSALNKVILSPDGKVIYASEPGRRVYAFESSSGKVIRQFEMDKYSTPSNNPQTISRIVTSADGQLLAASSEPSSRISVWDANTGEKFMVIGGFRNTITGIAFSPDSKLVARSYIVRSQIDVFEVTSNHK
jgi:WD40 repeat protein